MRKGGRSGRWVVHWFFSSIHPIFKLKRWCHLRYKAAQRLNSLRIQDLKYLLFELYRPEDRDLTGSLTLIFWQPGLVDMPVNETSHVQTTFTL